MTKGLFVTALLLALAAGCTTPPGSTAAAWSAQKLHTAKGFAVPECTAVDAASGHVYVSNIDAEPKDYWADDYQGSISKLNSDGDIIAIKWLNSSMDDPVHSPKGMCVLNDNLYFTDNTRLVKVPLDGSSPPSFITIPGAERLNDMATDGQRLWMTDSETGQIYRVDKAGKARPAANVEGVNGITCHDGRVYVVSWTLHDLFELNGPDFQTAAPFSLAEHFTNLDGIEVLADGSFLVSDFMGNKISLISPDRQKVHTLIAIESPADIGINHQTGRLYIPGFMTDSVHTFQLSKHSN